MTSGVFCDSTVLANDFTISPAATSKSLSASFMSCGKSISTDTPRVVGGISELYLTIVYQRQREPAYNASCGTQGKERHMPSKAKMTFDQNCADVDRLLEIHADLAGPAPGRKFGVEVLNKSAVVLICAFWEAFVEVIVAEAL